MAANYDARCADATSAAETRLLDHFKQFGGEVWQLGRGCESCRAALEDTSELKKCATCRVALFCGRECQKKAWRAHKRECLVISSLQRAVTDDELEMMRDATARNARLRRLLQALSWSTDALKASPEPTVVGVAKSIGMDASALPGWFTTVSFEQLPKERQQQAYEVVLELYSLLRDDECWTRDKESFPRSSYTYVDSLAHALPGAEMARAEFVALNGHLALFSAWLQHPEPPATQSLPLESRDFFGVVDSLLQIRELHDGVDAFMVSNA